MRALLGVAAPAIVPASALMPVKAIDLSDIPEAGEEWFAKARLRKITYRTGSELWGAGKGCDLRPAEIDMNFYDLHARLVEIEDALAQPRRYRNGYFLEEYPPILPRKWSKDQL